MDDHKINVLYLIDHLHAFGGTERHLFQLSYRLDRNRFKVMVVPFRCRERTVNAFRDVGIEVEPMPIKRIYGISGLTQAPKLMKLIRERKIDIVQTFNRDSDLYGTIIAKLSGAPIVISSRRDLGKYRTWRYRMCSKWVNRYVDHFITVCDAVADTLFKSEGVSSEKTTTIYNGFDLNGKSHIRQSMVEDLKKKYNIGRENFVVGMIAHFRPEKGYDIFFDAMQRLKQHIPELRVVAIGDGDPLYSTLKSQIENKGHQNWLLMPGYVSNVLENLSLMDVTCLTPVSNEGFSNALLEQMGMGKAIIATDVGGNAEAIVDGESGLIIPPGDAEALTAAVLRLYRDDDLRQSLGRNAYQRVQTEFDIKKMIARVENLYTQVYESKVGINAAGAVRENEPLYV